MRQKMFSQIDTSGDGSIDKNEIAALTAQNTSTLLEDLFGKLDIDQDDLISQIEFDSGLAKLEQQMKNGSAQNHVAAPLRAASRSMGLTASASVIMPNAL